MIPELSPDDEARAVRLHRESLVIDSHADTMVELWKHSERDFLRQGSWPGREVEEFDYHATGGQIDLPRLRQGGVDVTFMVATYAGSSGGLKGALDTLIGVQALQRRARGQLMVVRNAAEIRFAHRAGMYGVFWSVERSLPEGADRRTLELLAQLGVRTLSLFGCGDDDDDGRLPPDILDLLHAADDLGLMIDVCHMTRTQFDQVADTVTGQIVDTHTNAWTLNHTGGADSRNRTDDEAREVARRGGVIGVNSYPPWVDAERPSLQRFADHIEHFVDIAGIDHVGIGIDFDGMGVKRLPELNDVTDMPNITRELVRRGWDDRSIRKVLGENWLRAIAVRFDDAA